MLEKVPEDSLVPLSDRMDDADPDRDLPFSDTLLPFSLEDEELFFLIRGIFYRMRIIDIALPLSDKEEIEGTIDGECEDESGSEDTEYCDRNEGEEFSENPRKSHHRDEDDDRRHDSRNNRNTVFSEGEHDR